MATNFHYRVSTLWWGGWGSDEAIARHIEQNAGGGWRLTRTETAIRWWLWLIPRPKVLFIFERAA